jgi:hypothetical protein
MHPLREPTPVTVIDAHHDDPRIPCGAQAVQGLVDPPFAGEAGAGVEEVLAILQVEHGIAAVRRGIAGRQVDPHATRALQLRHREAVAHHGDGCGPRARLRARRARRRPAGDGRVHGDRAGRRNGHPPVRGRAPRRIGLRAVPRAERQLELHRPAHAVGEGDRVPAGWIQREAVGGAVGRPPVPGAGDVDRCVRGRGARNGDTQGELRAQR